MDTAGTLLKVITDLLNTLYEKFFLRDFLGKILPGLIVLITVVTYYFSEKLGNTFTPNVIFNAFKSVQPELSTFLSFLVWAGVIGFCYLLGFCTQRAGELVGLHSAHRSPKVFFNKNGEAAREKFHYRLNVFKCESEITNDQKSQRERYAIIKEMTGNAVLPLCLLGLTLLRIKGYFPYSISVFTIAILSWSAHISNRIRQEQHEESAMRIIGIVPKDKKSAESEESKYYTRARKSNAEVIKKESEKNSNVDSLIAFSGQITLKK